MSALQPILHNEIYIGRVAYGRRVFHKDCDTGRRIAREVPASEWIVRSMPEFGNR